MNREHDQRESWNPKADKRVEIFTKLVSWETITVCVVGNEKGEKKEIGQEKKGRITEQRTLL